MGIAASVYEVGAIISAHVTCIADNAVAIGDAVRNMGIRDSKVVALSNQMLTGKQKIDAEELIVAPGFIDLHEYGQEQ